MYQALWKAAVGDEDIGRRGPYAQEAKGTNSQKPCPIARSEIFYVSSYMVASSHTCLLNTWNMASVTKQQNSKFNLNYFK